MAIALLAVICEASIKDVYLERKATVIVWGHQRKL